MFSLNTAGTRCQLASTEPSSATVCTHMSSWVMLSLSSGRSWFSMGVSIWKVRRCDAPCLKKAKNPVRGEPFPEPSLRL